MTIILPEAVRAEAERKANIRGFASVDEYVLSLLLRALASADGGPAAGRSAAPPAAGDRAELEALIEEGMASGDEVEADDAFWAAERQRLLDRAAEKRGTIA